MIDSEFELFIKLGGEIRYLDIINALEIELKNTESYQSLSVNSTERKIILDRAMLMILAQDHAHLITLMAKTKHALDDGNTKAAFNTVNSAFK